MQTASVKIAAVCLFLSSASAAEARSTFVTPDLTGGSGSVLQCVPYARQTSGIRIYGDAHTWWNQANGKYARGNTPRVGAVMAVQPHGNSTLGHVATVSRIVDSRTILLRHANWSQPGLIEDNVKALDVSDRNDWSAVRIWYAPSQSLGANHWPLYGFIYSEQPSDLAKSPKPTARKARSVDLIADIISGKRR